MSEQHESRLRPFVGELFLNPAPLECSFNECRRCDYCFALNNGRQKDSIDPRATLSHLTRVFRSGGNPINLADRLLAERFPVVFSNAVDPLWFQNLPSTRAVLGALQKMDVPVILQTRGTDKPKDFPGYLDLLPDDSVLYCSLTTESEAVRREMERGSPSHEARCEMMAMAAERGVPVIAALNPVDAETIGDLGRFFDVIDRTVGAGVKGCWVEPLHISARQRRAIKARHPQGLPVIYGGAVERAAAEPWVIDGYFVRDLLAEVERRGWKVYSSAFGPQLRGRADLFDLWPNPFPTHHGLVAACREVSERHGGAPVGVTFEVFCSWLDGGTGVLDWEIRRKDAWFLLNQKQNVDYAEREAIGRTISLRECLAFLWENPLLRVSAVYGAFGLKALAELTPAAKRLLAEHVDRFPEGPVLDEDELRQALGGADPIHFYHRDGERNLLAVWAPDLGTDRVVGEGELDDERPLVMLESFEASLADAA